MCQMSASRTNHGWYFGKSLAFLDMSAIFGRWRTGAGGDFCHGSGRLGVRIPSALTAGRQRKMSGSQRSGRVGDGPRSPVVGA
jgi:hypothetical protein